MNNEDKKQHKEHKAIADIRLSSFHFGEYINGDVKKALHSKKRKRAK